LTRKRFFFGCALLTTSVLGCGEPLQDPTTLKPECPEWSTPPEEGEPLNTEPPQKTIDVAGCAGGASQVEIDKNLEFATTLEKSFEHLLTCGRFSQSFAFGVAYFFAALSCGYPTTPYPFSYAGTGYYHAGPLNVQTKLLKDTPFGKAGDDIPFDLFDTNNYFESNFIRAGLSADATWNTNGDYAVHLSGVIEMTLTKPKPEALALWGIEAVDGKPVSVAQEALAKTIGESVSIMADANVQEVVDKAVTYQIAVPELSVGSMYQGDPAPVDVINLAATKQDTNQTASLVDWGLEYVPIKIGAIDGAITVRIEGGTFPYYIRYTYPKRLGPDVLVTCTAPPPL
jgi:hypothetical protein